MTHTRAAPALGRARARTHGRGVESPNIEIRLGGNRLRSMAHAGSASGYCQAGKPFMCIEANLSFINKHTRLAERWAGKACRRGSLRWLLLRASVSCDAQQLIAIRAEVLSACDGDARANIYVSVCSSANTQLCWKNKRSDAIHCVTRVRVSRCDDQCSRCPPHFKAIAGTDLDLSCQ